MTAPAATGGRGKAAVWIGLAVAALIVVGFATRAESRNGQLRLVSEHCPFGDAAVEHPVICAVDRGMVKGMLGALYGDTTPATEASLPMGDQRCVTAVPE